jgi:hypothetical protein
MVLALTQVQPVASLSQDKVISPIHLPNVDCQLTSYRTPETKEVHISPQVYDFCFYLDIWFIQNNDQHRSKRHKQSKPAEDSSSGSSHNNHFDASHHCNYNKVVMQKSS